MKVIIKKIGEIKPYEKNPRHNDEAVELVKNSIEKFGWKVPIVVDKKGVIIAGHTRYKAALQMGIDEVPVVVADDLNAKQAKAYRLADNKVGEAEEAKRKAEEAKREKTQVWELSDREREIIDKLNKQSSGVTP